MKSLFVIIANVEAPATDLGTGGAIFGVTLLILAGWGAVSIVNSLSEWAKKKWGPKPPDEVSEVKNLAANPGRPMRRNPDEKWLSYNLDTVYLLTKEGPQTSTVKAVRDGIFEAACYPFTNPIIPT